MIKFPVVVAPPAIVRPPDCVPFPIVDEAYTPIPTVVVGESAPFEISHDLPKRDEERAYELPSTETTPESARRRPVPRPENVTVPVAVRFAAERLPEKSPSPCTE